MSKIGRRPILFSTAKVEVTGSKIQINGPKLKLIHEIPATLVAMVKDGTIALSRAAGVTDCGADWGLHRALLANKIKGVESGFEQLVKIVGLGYKAQASGKKLVFSLGYSHKIEYTMPEAVTVDIDKTGQQLTFKSYDRLALGNVCDDVRRFKPVEPYKGTGVMRSDETVIRKAGKTAAKTA